MDASLDLRAITVASKSGLKTTNNEWVPCTTTNIKIEQQR
jgi:hypothetical protein